MVKANGGAAPALPYPFLMEAIAMLRNQRNADPQPIEFDRLTVEKIMNPDVWYAHPQTKADVIASMMIEGFGGVPIVDDYRRLVGIVTEFDLLAVLDGGKQLRDVPAGEIMTPDAVRVSPHTDMRTLIYVLQTSHLIRVPVVDGEGKLIGIVARRDVLRGYLNSPTG